jgi:hypothetical protein
LESKISKHLQFCGRAHYSATRKYLEISTQLDEPAECASGGDLLFFYKIPHLLFFLLVQILCAPRLKSGKKYQHALDAGPLKLQFLRQRGYLTNPVRKLSLCFGVIGKTSGLISGNNFIKKNFLHRPSR